MGTSAAVLAVLILSASGLFFAWLRPRFPKGWVGVGLRMTSHLGISATAVVAWQFAVRPLTSAQYVCIECGRTERQAHFGSFVVSRSLLTENTEYLQRFAGPHEHDWYVEGCITSFDCIACTMRYADAWYRDLPQLSDRRTAEALVREVRAMPPDERWRTICSWDREVSRVVQFEHLGLDEAFARWQSARARPDGETDR